MRNLKLIGRSLLRFSSEGDPLPLSATAWDPASNSIICAFGPSASRAVIELKRLHYEQDSVNGRLESIASWDAPCPLPDLPNDLIIDLHHLSDSATTCLVLAGGDIILVREDPLDNQDLVEIVGSIDAGISAAAWSPDEELLAITTRADTLLLFSRDIENISSINLTPEDVNVSSHVSVGWGKKETQFKGKRAKALQDPTVPERVDEGTLSPNEDQSVTISWRGDGAYFALSTVEQQQRRMIRVYSREGQLDSVSEPVDGLEGALSWRPSGNLIAGVQRSADKTQVVFFERNGLRHGQFDLRLSPEELQSLTTPLRVHWNNDSNVLAVTYPQKVQLWTMSNYHYFLKQEIELPEAAMSAITTRWHSERPLAVTVATSDSLQVLDYTQATAGGSTVPPNDLGVVAVIDGLTLKVTPLRIANVPPPMSFLQIPLEKKAVDVAISATNSRIAVISNSDVSVYSLDLHKRPVPKPTLLWRSDSLQDYLPRQVAFIDDRVYVLTDSWQEEESSLWLSNDNQQLDFLGRILEPGRASSIVQRADYHSIYVQFYSGLLYDIRPDGTLDNFVGGTQSLLPFPTFTPTAQVTTVDSQQISIGLTNSGVLYANDRILVRNCTSFIVTNAHLIFTTTQHLLKFVHLTNVEDMEVPADEPQTDERCRSIERGARIVTAMPTTYSVVLQMPRGNLETIYPRAMVLAAIRRSIEKDQYGEAFLACRNQRVDMNILHDHDPQRFMRSIEKMVTQVKRIEHIDLFLSQLRNEDVSETMYKETLKTKDQAAKASVEDYPIESKVNRICDAFLAVLEQTQYKETHLQNIITSHVCKVPADLESGLEMIGRLQASQDPLTEKAAEHICFLADVNQLYDTALGIYNLELALLIAQQSQKDPREYLPHLQSLHDLPLTRRKFKIDDQLSRHTKALQHLKDLSAFDELQAYVQNHTLYREALELYQYDTSSLDQIMRLYADHLAVTNQHKDAALAYTYLSDHASAHPHYLSALLWREALSSATLAGVSDQDLASLATSLAEGLTESKDYLSAATIHLDYLSDLPTSARLLCRGCFFPEAIRLIVLHRNPTLLEEIIDPSLIERSAETTEFLADMRTQLQNQVPRLRELRKKKLEDPMAFFEGTFEGGNADIPDNISVAQTDTTSGGTFMTRYTNRTGTVNTATTRRTSKKKRQEERKRARGKKGTVYEEEYLVNSIERLVERLNVTVEEVERLVAGLVGRRMRERADAVTRSVQEVGALCREAVKELWEGKEESQAAAPPAGFGGVDGNEGLKPQGADATLWASFEEVNKKRDPPVIKEFGRLSLLG
ncbi:elongator complex protein 1 [Aaosphaeria arxii CBS 175.79]|uniref:Elongator complex protein 1 n=1 Tax=Aaosphaeria arxii CBS 175.79 TaxID=1450172 RepID=A0A6A5XKL3_9PLEO|nr:elongator complex protein 1 [Aaosphaeria arxii CBS 175.79]KAF2013672.1 elongator complex protein 1 [Aaosphaeria arxii CBS 175.79]